MSPTNETSDLSGGVPTVDDLHATWSPEARPFAGQEPFSLAVLDRLADGQPADAAWLAKQTGLDPADIQQRLQSAAASGWEFEDGAIVGAALTLNPTAHQFTVHGHELYTWCGFDALFLPILLGETAHVRSTCPATGQTIALTVAADGTVTDVSPATTVVAIVGSQVTACCPTVGRDSAVCTQMPFLASPAAGQEWLAGRSGVAVVDLGTATAVARTFAS